MAQEGFVSGTAQLIKQLKAMGNKTQVKAMRNGLAAAARVVAKQAAQNIPVGVEAHKTYRGVLVAPGFAKRSIVVRSFVNRRTGLISAVVGVRAQAFYAVQFVELERGKSTEKGKPWLTPAFESTQRAQMAAVEKALQRAIMRAIKSAG